MFKDKDKQREANRQASKKYRDSMTGKGMTVIIPKSDIRVIPKPKGMTDVEIMQGMTVMDERSMVAIDTKPKRGKDIKVFSDLPLDVKRTIVRLTTKSDGSIDHSARANRIAIAVNYHHLFIQTDTIVQE